LVEKLGKAVEELTLPAVDRLGIQNDLFALATAGKLSTAKALQFSLHYENETEYAVWSDLLSNIHSVGSVWFAEPNYHSFQRFQRKLLSSIFSKLGWNAKEGEPSTHSLLRANVISVLGGSGETQIVEEAKKKFQHYLQDSSSLSPDLRGAVWKISVSHGGIEEYDKVYHISQHANEHAEKVKALTILGSTPSEDLIKKTLEMVLDSKQVRTQDSFYVIAGCSANPKGTLATWEWFKSHWDAIFKQFGDGGFLLGHMISSATKSFTEISKAKEIEHFFSDKNVPSAKRTIQQSIETITSNANWLSRDKTSVAEFLKKFEN